MLEQFFVWFLCVPIVSQSMFGQTVREVLWEIQLILEEAIPRLSFWQLLLPTHL